MWESLQLFNSLQLHEIIHIGEKLYEKKEFEKSFHLSHNLLKIYDNAQWEETIEMCRIWERLQLFWFLSKT